MDGLRSLPVVLDAGCDGMEMQVSVAPKMHTRHAYGAAVGAILDRGISAAVVGRAKKPRVGARNTGSTRSVQFPGGYLMFSRPQRGRQPVWTHLEPEALKRNAGGAERTARACLEAVAESFDPRGVRNGDATVTVCRLTAHADYTGWAPWAGIADDVCKRGVRVPVRWVDHGGGNFGMEVLHGYGREYDKWAKVRSTPSERWVPEFWPGWDGVSPVRRLEFTSDARFLRHGAGRDLQSVWDFWMTALTVYVPESSPRRRFRDRTPDPGWHALRGLRFPSIPGQDLPPTPTRPENVEAKMARFKGLALAYIANYCGLLDPAGESLSRDIPGVVAAWLRDPAAAQKVAAGITSAQARFLGKTPENSR